MPSRCIPKATILLKLKERSVYKLNKYNENINAAPRRLISARSKVPTKISDLFFIKIPRSVIRKPASKTKSGEANIDCPK